MLQKQARHLHADDSFNVKNENLQEIRKEKHREMLSLGQKEKE